MHLGHRWTWHKLNRYSPLCRTRTVHKRRKLGDFMLTDLSTCLRACFWCDVVINFWKKKTGATEALNVFSGRSFGFREQDVGF